ncbi:MAG: winged helix-turn-helix domain-containing protein [Methanobacteriota archaeon]
MSKDVVVVTDPKIIKVGIEDTRRKILALLRFNDLAVSQIAEVIGKDESTVYRHVEKLKSAGYIHVTGERTVHHIPERIYGRTAKVFILSPDEMKSADATKMLEKERREQVAAAVRIVAKGGYHAEDDELAVDGLADAFNELDQRTFKLFRDVDDVALADQGKIVRARMLVLLLALDEDAKLAAKFSKAIHGFSRV